MEITQAVALEKQLKRIASLACCMQGLWIAILSGLCFLCSDDFYPKCGQLLSAVALISSFAISRVYIKKGKDLEEIKTFSPEEREATKRKFFTVFASPYPLWVFMFIYFS